MLSSNTRGRRKPERECALRTSFQRDRDRIIHCKTFRRLKHKTQVFLSPGGDHYRTRLTHTLEVSQIARTMAKALQLNEDLTEAIALGHDLGHTPFGHAGEDVLNSIVPGGFRHPDQSLRVVDDLEKLNLTHEVRDGILKHSKRGGPILPTDNALLPETLEGQLVRIADSIAYLNHDLDDALRAKVITVSAIRRGAPAVFRRLGTTHSRRIGTMVNDVIATTLSVDMERVAASSEMIDTAMQLRWFLNEYVYNGAAVYSDFKKSSTIIEALYSHYVDNAEVFHRDAGRNFNSGSVHRDVCDFISGMTDRYAFKAYETLFLPQPWLIV